MLEAGDIAPDFTLIDDTGSQQSLHDFKGKQIVIYFYPKDDTPGCTTEACSFRDDYSLYQKAGVIILGISPDNEKSHSSFKLKYNLPFILLSDTDHRVCKLYGVWGPKKFMGREYEGVLRTTYLIDSDGKVVKVYKNVKPAEHSKEILENFNIK